MNKKMLVGSHALKKWFPEDKYLKNRGKDWDYWTNYTDDNKVPGQECHDVSKYSGLSTMLDRGRKYSLYPELHIPTVNELYTLKVSHSFWRIHWIKSINDIRFLQEQDAKLDRELFELLYADWVTIHGKKRASLNQTKEQFFTDNVDREYDHDQIHDILRYHDKPLYMSILKDGATVLTDKGKFDRLDELDKLRLVREEAYVTSAERFLIPSNFTEDPLIAYRKSLQLLITSMSKGHFPLHIVLNIKDLWNLDYDYASKIKKGLNI